MQGAAGSSDPPRTKPAWQRSQWSPSVLCWQPWGRGDRSAPTAEASLPAGSPTLTLQDSAHCQRAPRPGHLPSPRPQRTRNY